MAENSQRKGCLWAMNPAKITKLDEEVHKWSQKDPAGIKKGMLLPGTYRGERSKTFALKRSESFSKRILLLNSVVTWCLIAFSLSLCTDTLESLARGEMVRDYSSSSPPPPAAAVPSSSPIGMESEEEEEDPSTPVSVSSSQGYDSAGSDFDLEGLTASVVGQQNPEVHLQVTIAAFTRLVGWLVLFAPKFLP